MQRVYARLVFLILVPLLFVPASTLKAAGARITAHLKTGEAVSGELLAVTEDELLISKSPLLSEDKLKASPAEIIKVSRADIVDLAFNGQSHVVDGLLMGSIAGLVIGTLVSYEPRGLDSFGSNFDGYGPGSRALILGFIGGSVVGGLLGKAGSSSDQVIDFRGKKNLIFLRDFARYKEPNPPDFLQLTQ